MRFLLQENGMQRIEEKKEYTKLKDLESPKFPT